MKPNPPRAMLERLAFVVWLGLTSVSIGVVSMSPWFPWPEPGCSIFFAGSGGGIFAWLLGSFGRKRLHFTECEAALEAVEAPGEIFGEGSAAEHLRRVFSSWDELDEQRAHGDGDVWRVQELRREAASILQADPSLRAEFAHELSRHPELGDR